MKQVNNDLREALRLSEPKTPQLSADFADRLAERLQEDGTTSDVSPYHLNSPNGPHRWYRRVAAIFIGVLIIGILNNGLNLMGVNSDWQYIIKGAVILLAVYTDFLRNRKKSA